MGKFLEDLNIREDDVMSMVIPWKFGAKTLGVFTEEEFVRGMANVGYVLLVYFFASFLHNLLPNLTNQDT